MQTEIERSSSRRWIRGRKRVSEKGEEKYTYLSVSVVRSFENLAGINPIHITLLT